MPLTLPLDTNTPVKRFAVPDGYDPCAQARAAPRLSPIIHIPQSPMDKGGHRPVTAEFTATGRGQPALLIEPFRQDCGENDGVCLEPGFKEREPDARDVIPQIADFVVSWAPYIDTGISGFRGLR